VVNTLLAILIGAVVGVLLVLVGSAIMSVWDKRSKQNTNTPPGANLQKADAKPVASFSEKHGCLLRFMLLAAVAGSVVGYIVCAALANPIVRKDA
jgi:membrane protein DedA with SNARE-associated domain